jgi:hypothetical protein
VLCALCIDLLRGALLPTDIPNPELPLAFAPLDVAAAGAAEVDGADDRDGEVDAGELRARLLPPRARAALLGGGEFGRRRPGKDGEPGVSDGILLLSSQMARLRLAKRWYHR